MKVLWFSNCALADTGCTGSGSWLFGMKSIISEKIELFNITEDNVTEIEYHDDGDVKEYRFPTYKLKDSGLPSAKEIAKIKNIVDSISPDIIHVWGLEKYWAKLFSTGYIKGNVLLEIQGLMSSCYNVFYGGLTIDEVRNTHRLKEFIKPSVKLESQAQYYRQKAEEEVELLKHFNHISTQSEWTRYQISLFKKEDAVIYNTLRPIRKEFYEASKWIVRGKNNPLTIFTSVGYNIPFKGMHVLLKAFKLVVDKYKDAKLVIAGLNPNVPLYKDNGYDRLLKDYIRDHELGGNVEFPGRLNASQIITYLRGSDIYANPTFIESYSAATAEALFLGVPSVLSYAGALPYFASRENVALFYSPLDYVDCAAKIVKLYQNDILKRKLSDSAICSLSSMNGIEAVAETQLDIYRKVIDSN